MSNCVKAGDCNGLPLETGECNPMTCTVCFSGISIASPRVREAYLLRKSLMKELMEDIQTGGDEMWWDIVHAFPESMKGTIAKGLWDLSVDGYGLEAGTDQHLIFSYGIEYGALIILNHLLGNRSLRKKVKHDES